MNSAFLHENKNVPADKIDDRLTPACAKCGAEMWLVRVDKILSDGKTETSYTYKCKQCGSLAKRNEVEAEPRATVSAIE